ncbi:MAG: hypothetical protein QM679_07150 [Patulibacter sp.]
MTLFPLEPKSGFAALLPGRRRVPSIESEARRAGVIIADGDAASQSTPPRLDRAAFDVLRRTTERALAASVQAGAAQIHAASDQTRRGHAERPAIARDAGDAREQADTRVGQADAYEQEEPQRQISDAQLRTARRNVLLATGLSLPFDIVLVTPVMRLLLNSEISNGTALTLLALLCAAVPVLLMTWTLHAMIARSAVLPTLAQRYKAAAAAAGMLAVVVVTIGLYRGSAMRALDAMATIGVSGPKTPAPQLAGAVAAPADVAAGGAAPADAVEQVLRTVPYEVLIVVSLLSLLAVTAVLVQHNELRLADEPHRLWRERHAELTRRARMAVRGATSMQRRLDAVDGRRAGGHAQYEAGAWAIRNAIETYERDDARLQGIVQVAYRHRCAQRGVTPRELPLPDPIDREALLERILGGVLPQHGGEQPAAAGEPPSDMPPMPSDAPPLGDPPAPAGPVPEPLTLVHEDAPARNPAPRPVSTPAADEPAPAGDDAWSRAVLRGLDEL